MKIFKKILIFGFILILNHCDHSQMEKSNIIKFPEKLEKDYQENHLNYYSWGTWEHKIFLPKVDKDYLFENPQHINISRDGKLYLSDKRIMIFSLTNKLINTIKIPDSFKILFDNQGDYYIIRKNMPDQFGGRKYVFINKFDKNHKFIFSYKHLYDYHLNDAAINFQNNLYLILNGYQPGFPIIKISPDGIITKISPDGIITKINILKSYYIQNLKIDSNGNFWIIHYQANQPQVFLFDNRVYQISVYDSKWNHVVSYKPNISDLFIPIDMDFDQYGNIYIQNIGAINFWYLKEKQRINNIPTVLKFDKNFKFIKKWQNKSNFIKVIYSKYLFTSKKINSDNPGQAKMIIYDLEGELIKSWQINGCENGKLNDPFQGKMDEAGNIYIKDRCFGERIQKFVPEGNYLKSWKASIKKDQSEMNIIFNHLKPLDTKFAISSHVIYKSKD